MINKAATATSSASVSVDAQSSSANAQAMGGNLVSVSNTSDASMETLPLEMLYHIGSFLQLKDKVSFHQALIDAGMIYLDEKEVSKGFHAQFLTQKVNILLDGNMEDYDFSKFYSEVHSEGAENIYSLLFDKMCADFKKRKALSEEIVTLVEQIEAAAFVMVPHPEHSYDVEEINSDLLDGMKICAFIDREDQDEPKNTKELVEHLFPNLTSPEIRAELEERVQQFDSKKGLLSRTWSFSPLALTKRLFAFLKMEEQYRGIPIKLAARTQKLASSHLQPIIQKASEKMQAMPIEALRALLIMTIDKEQVEDFCEKIIEMGAKDNPFYAKGSPYYPMLKHDLSHRMDLFAASSALPYGDTEIDEAYLCHVCYHADDESVRGLVSSLMSKILAVQIKNDEEPVSENQLENLHSLRLAFYSEVRAFHNKMEQQYPMVDSLKQRHRNAKALMRSQVPDSATFEENTPEHMLSSFARCECFFSSLMELLEANPHYVNAQDVNGDTLLHLVIKMDTDMVVALAGLNADLNIKNKEGLTPLMLAVQSENMLRLSELLKQPALDVNKCDDSGNTALHRAILTNKKMAMHRLLRHGATDQTIANADGKTPRMLAESLGLLSIYDTLAHC